MNRLERMSPPITGGCACGSVRYTCASSPIWSCNCHCRACQRMSGAPFVSAFTVRIEHFQQVGDDTIDFERTSEAGHRVTTVHCKGCGARMFAQSEGNKAIMNIFASTLDDPSVFTPISNVYVSEAARWIVLDGALMAFEKMPG